MRSFHLIKSELEFGMLIPKNMADVGESNSEDRGLEMPASTRPVPNGTVIQNIPGFVSKLNDLITLAEKDDSRNSPLLEICQELYHSGQELAVSIDKELRRRLSVQEQCQATSAAFNLSLQRLVYLNKVCEGLQDTLTQQQKQINESESNKRRRLKPASTKESKHHVAGGAGFSPKYSTFSTAPPTSSQTLPSRGGGAGVNTYEDFRKQVMPEILHSSLPNQVASSPRVGHTFAPVRKARSETDLKESEMEKELKSLHVDNTRLRDSEKKLRKDNSHLQRKCKTLEKERDKAEDRLQVEQSNRDSLAKLRKRNEELETQLKILCQEEVWKERHKDVTDVLDSVKASFQIQNDTDQQIPGSNLSDSDHHPSEH